MFHHNFHINKIINAKNSFINYVFVIFVIIQNQIAKAQWKNRADFGKLKTVKVPYT